MSACSKQERSVFGWGRSSSQRGGGVYGDEQTRTVVKGMEHHADVADSSRREGLAKLGYAAHLGRARLDEVHGSGIQQATEFQQGRLL